MVPDAPNRTPESISFLLAFVFVAAVGTSLVYVNATGPDWDDLNKWLDGGSGSRFDRQRGWPVTYLVLPACVPPELERAYWRGMPPSSRRPLLIVHAIVADIVWAAAMLAASWAVSRRFLATARHRQYSLRTMLVATTLVALGLFLATEYIPASSASHEVGQPYLPISALYRWFGPSSPYDWLSEFPEVIRFVLLAGWFCMVYSGCSCIWRLVRRPQGRPTDADHCNARLDVDRQADSAGRAVGIQTTPCASRRGIGAESGT